jgi:hypothetical protein
MDICVQEAYGTLNRDDQRRVSPWLIIVKLSKV